MRIIGVIDLKDGHAVHARGGRRETSAAVRRSAGLAIDGDPATLARHYVETMGLTDIYLADLDAIGSGRLQQATIRSLSALGASLLVDAGIAHAVDARRVAEAGAAVLVVGLETLPSFDALADVCAQRERPVAFSLDLRNGIPMTGGPAMTAATPEEIARLAARAGVESIIVLDVARVGVAAGPDTDMLRRIRSAVPEVPLLAGGGIRDLDDLRALAHLGCAGALVATALHAGRLTTADVAAAQAF